MIDAIVDVIDSVIDAVIDAVDIGGLGPDEVHGGVMLPAQKVGARTRTRCRGARCGRH